MKKKNTRNAHGSGSIRQRSNGLWEARYTIGFNPQDGKQVQKSVYGKTQQEVRKKLQSITASIDNGTYSEPSKFTVAAWCDIWLSEYTKHLKDRTRIEYGRTIKNYIVPNIGNIKLKSLRPHIIQTFINSIDLSPKTVKNIHGILHKVLEQARQIGYIHNNPASGTKLPRWTRKDVTPLETQEITSFLQAIKGDRYENIFFITLFTGLRRSEVLGLTWDCIDFEHGTIYVYRQLQRIGKLYQFAPLKNNKPRTLSPAPAVIQVLKEQRKTQNEWKLKAGQAWQPWENAQLVFTDEIGNHLSHNTVYKHFKTITQSIGIYNKRFHDLRHTYAVMALNAGDDIKTIQEQLGHHTAAFTLDIYGHLTEKMRKDSSERMQKYIEDLQ